MSLSLEDVSALNFTDRFIKDARFELKKSGVGLDELGRVLLKKKSDTEKRGKLKRDIHAILYGSRSPESVYLGRMVDSLTLETNFDLTGCVTFDSRQEPKEFTFNKLKDMLDNIPRIPRSALDFVHYPVDLRIDNEIEALLKITL